MPKEKKLLKHVVGSYVFYLKRVERAQLLMLLSQNDRPPVPMREVSYLGGATGMEPNPSDKQYREDLDTWQAVYNAKMFRQCLVSGLDHVVRRHGDTEVPAAPTPEEVSKIRFINGAELSTELATYFWLAEIIGDTANAFMSLVMGQTLVTPEGLAEDEERFRTDSEGSGIRREDNDIPTPTAVEDGIPF